MSIVLKESLKYALRSKPLISREIRHVDWLYSLTADELHEYKEKRFLNIFRRAYKNSPFYNGLYHNEGIEEGDITSLDDLAKLPILTKEMVRRESENMLTVPRWLVSTANTSGTTGTPLTAYHSYKAIRLEQAYNWYRRRRYGFVYGENKQISLRGNLGADKFMAYVPISRTLYLSSYQITGESAKRYFGAIQKFKPSAIEGYPSSLYNLAQVLDENGYTLSIPTAFTSSETLFPFQREVIERVFDTELFDRYGCTERSASFSESIDHSGYYEDPGYCHTEMFDSYIITTSLINSAFPLIRYQVDDVLVTDGNGYVQAIEGRSEDVVVCKNGTRVGRLDHILKGVKGISLAQVVQRMAGKIEVRFVPDSGFNDESIRQIENGLYDKIDRSNIDVNFLRVDNDGIIYSSRNKFSFVKSYL